MQIAATLTAPLLRPASARATVTRLSQRLPGSARDPDSNGRSLVIAIARDPSGAPLATTALTGPEPYQTTPSLIAWGALHTAALGATTLPAGVHGPIAAFGLDTLRNGATESGLHEADDPPG